MDDLQVEASRYDLPSLIALQDKRRENVALFERSIQEEREISTQEERARVVLEEKIRLHEIGVARLDVATHELVSSDLPKLVSTRARREETIGKLEAAIVEERSQIAREGQMITFLQAKEPA